MVWWTPIWNWAQFLPWLVQEFSMTSESSYWLFNGPPWLPLEHPISSQKPETPGVGPPSSVSVVVADGLVVPVYCTTAPDCRLKWKIIGGQLKTNDRWLHRSCRAHSVLPECELTVLLPSSNCFPQQVYPPCSHACPQCTDWCLANYRQILYLLGPQWIRVIDSPRLPLKVGN